MAETAGKYDGYVLTDSQKAGDIKLATVRPENQRFFVNGARANTDL